MRTVMGGSLIQVDEIGYQQDHDQRPAGFDDRFKHGNGTPDFNLSAPPDPYARSKPHLQGRPLDSFESRGLRGCT
jgi:hypothetical protein